ncbi:MAG: aldolase [Armatimonadetes bacterium]|nr:aldolase [Armatimonadota bacterium]
MSLGKRVRLNRLFSHPSGRYCSIAVDHFIGYSLGDSGLPLGLRRIRQTLAEIVEAQPDAVTMHRGIMTSAWEPFAGKVPSILQGFAVRPDDFVCEQVADPEDAVRLGVEAIAFAGFVRGATEGRHLRALSDCVKAAVRFEMPVIAHIYPRKFRETVEISLDPEDIAWAVRCAMECGADVIKTPFCDDPLAFSQIVEECTVPLVAAGGPKTESIAETLTMLQTVVACGAKGATVGRNAWGSGNTTATIQAMKAVIHEGTDPEEAAAQIGGDRLP